MMSDLAMQCYYGLLRCVVKNKALIERPEGAMFGITVPQMKVDEAKKQFANELWFIEVSASPLTGSCLLIKDDELRKNWERFEELEYVKLLRYNITQGLVL